MKGSIIAITVIVLLFAGVYGAMMVHGGDAQVSTNVYILKNNEKVTTVMPGDSVKIAVEVKNVGGTAFTLSGHVPVFAYANIYQDTGVLKKIESVKYTTKYVTWHAVYLNPGENYTAYIDWNVPENLSGKVVIQAWAGGAPKANTTIYVGNSQASTSSGSTDVEVITDDVMYYDGNVVQITIINYGNSIATFPGGFEVVDEDGNVVYTSVGTSYITLQPGDSVTYTWTIPDGISSGWYYIYSGANGNYAQIYIY